MGTRIGMRRGHGARAVAVAMATAAAAVVVMVAAAEGCRRAARDGAPGACGREIPASELWAEATDAQLDARIAEASACARRRGARVLLEFVATWCEDCQHMTRLEQTPAVASVIRERYERVRVNVGRWDRHRALLQRYGIDRIAAYVVLDPTSGQRVAQTTVEPVTGGTPMTPDLWAAWLRNPR